MASTSAVENKESDVEMENHLRELEKVRNEQELDAKLGSMSRMGFSIASWMKVWFNRDTKEDFHAVWLTIDEYKSMAEQSMQDAFRVVRQGTGWREEKRGSRRGDVVESMQSEQFGKLYRFTGVVDCPATFLYEEFKNNLTRLPEWNPTILKSELIKEISPGIDLSYQVTAGGGRGIISPRDFVILRRTAALTRGGEVLPEDAPGPHAYISSGVSVAVPGYPPNKDMVRGHNKVGCWYLRPQVTTSEQGDTHKTVFQWLMCCDLKGKIPQFVLDAAFSTVMLEYIVHVRKLAADAAARGLF